MFDILTQFVQNNQQTKPLKYIRNMNTERKRITRNDREELNGTNRPEGWIGWDCFGEVIKSGDKVQVVEEETERKGRSDYGFCSVGRMGKAVGHSGHRTISWCVSVCFPNDGGATQTAWCADYRLQKSP